MLEQVNRGSSVPPDDAIVVVGSTVGNCGMTSISDDEVWRGSSQGIVDLVGVLPFAEGVVPYNYGEAHYIGEGAYEGLEYHYFISGSNAKAGVTGWITSSD